MASFWTWRKVAEGETQLEEFIRICNSRMVRLSAAINDLLGLVQSVDIFPNGSTAPSVAGSKLWQANNTVPTSITTFTDGQPGTEVLVWSTTANTTLVHSAAAGGIRMKGGANVTMTATETRRFASVDGISWRET